MMQRPGGKGTRRHLLLEALETAVDPKDVIADEADPEDGIIDDA
jgi:hypothetical protein